MPKTLAKRIIKQDAIDIKAAVSNLNDLNLRKKAFVSLVASKVLCEFLQEQGVTVISENNNPLGLLLLKDFDVADIIAENNIKIAVRALVGDDYPQMCIPKSHFSNNISADIYVGVRVESNIDKAELVGFTEVGNINKRKGNNKYVFVKADQLRPIEELKQAINLSRKHKKYHLAADHEKTKELFFQYTENRISSFDKEFFAGHIASCDECSKEFNQIIELDNLIKKAGHKFNFEEENADYTLRLFAGDPLLLGEAVETEFIYDEDNEDTYENIQDAAYEAYETGEINEIKQNNFVRDKKKKHKKHGKHISGRKIVRAVTTAGGAALAVGALSGGGHAFAVIQAAGLAGTIKDIGKGVALPLAQAAAENLVSLTESIDFGNLKNNENSCYEQATSKINESENINNFDEVEAQNTLSDDFQEVNFEESFELSTENFNDDELQNLASYDETEERDFDESFAVSTENFDEFRNLESCDDFDESPDNEHLLLNHENLPSASLAQQDEFAEKLPETAEAGLLKDHGESITLSDNEPQSFALLKELREDKQDSVDKETLLEKNTDDEGGDVYSIDDLLASLDSVEVVEAFDMFNSDKEQNSISEGLPKEDIKEDTDFEQPEVNNTEIEPENTTAVDLPEFINRDNQDKNENLLDEMYQGRESVPVKYQGMQFNNNFEKNFSEPEVENNFKNSEDEENFDLDDFEEEDNVDSEKGNSLPGNIKAAAGLAAAGIVITVAIALWANNRPAMNNNFPLINNFATENNQVLKNPQISKIPLIPKDLQTPPVTPQAANTESEITPPESSAALNKTAPAASEENTRKDLSAVLADAFSKRTYEVNIRNISWEITKDMAQNSVFKNYIMVTGQALKSALARDLASAEERALNTQMEIKTVMDLNGNILEATVIQSSGSEEVDKICLDTFRTTVQFTKLPKIKVKKDKIKANLIVSF